MRPSGLSDLELTEYLDLDGAPRLEAKSARTGLHVDCNLSNAKDDLGIEAHCGTVFAQADESTFELMPGIASVMSLYPEITRMPGTTSADGFPPNKSSHQTGGPDRCFTVRSGLLMLKGPDDVQQWKGFGLLRSYVTATLNNRPICHRLNSICKVNGDINPGTPEAWHTDRFTAAGWNAYDVAHAHFAPEHLLGQIGDPLGVLVFALRWSLIAKGHPPSTNFWHNQERSTGVLIEDAVMAVELGLGAGDDEALQVMFGGLKPKRMLNDMVARVCAELPQWTAAWAADLDERKLPILDPKDWRHAGPQLQGHYTYQMAQLLFGLSRALASNLLKPELAEVLAPRIEALADYVIERAWLRGTGKLAWTFGSFDFLNQQIAQDVIDAATALGKPKPGNDPLFALEGGKAGGQWFVGTEPKLQDAEMTCAALSLANEALRHMGRGLSSFCLEARDAIRAALPAIDSQKYCESSKAFTRYLTVADAVAQREAAVQLT